MILHSYNTIDHIIVGTYYCSDTCYVQYYSTVGVGKTSSYRVE